MRTMPFTMLTAAVGKFWDKALNCIPFILMVKNGGPNKIELNLNRIIEAVIIAAITAAVIGYTVRDDIQRIEAKVDKIYTDIYMPTMPSSHEWRQSK